METQDKSLLDFQNDWEKVVDKGYKDFNSLTPDERIWFNIQGLIDSVDNGGFISLYYNSGADYNKETIEDLITLGFKDIADILLQINSWFPDGQPSREIEERNQVINSWTEDKHEDELYKFDQEFYLKEKFIEDKLIQLIETKISKK